MDSGRILIPSISTHPAMTSYFLEEIFRILVVCPQSQNKFGTKMSLGKDGTPYLNAAKVPRTGSYDFVELVEKEGMGTRKVVVKEIYIDRSI